VSIVRDERKFQPQSSRTLGHQEQQEEVRS